MVKSKKAIAMIELIFALVIIGIVLMSAPMLIQQSINSGNVALQQEAIAAAASHTSVILSMHWDDNNNTNTAGVSPILDTNRLPFDFNSTAVPLGLVGVKGRNSINAAGIILPATAVTSLGRDFTDNNDTNETDFTRFDDVDDYDGSSFGLTVFNNETTTADVGDYVDVDLNMTTQINYAEDRVNTGDNNLLNGTSLTLHNRINSTSIGAISNIKFIRVNLTSDSGVDELNKSITFQAFSCNIGTSTPQPQGENY